MKRLFLLIFSAFLLIACNDKNEDVKGEDIVEDENKEVEVIPDEEEDELEDEVEEEIEEEIEPKYVINENTWYIEPIDEETDEDVVLVTIDDAPEHYALEMAESLKELDVPAIFFVNGHFLETDEKKETLRKIYDMGFVIGNHTYSHQSLQSIDEEEQRKEIITVNDQVEDIIGERPVFFRAPFGQYSDYAKDLLAEEKMTFMNWSYGYDWEKDYMEKEALADIMVNAEQLRAGANLLMHDREWTNAALKDIILGLKEKGYGFIDPKEIELLRD